MIFAVENVLLQNTPLNVQVGDLFVTEKEIHFIVYAQFGTVGLSEIGRRQGAMEYAASWRQLEYGMTMAQRLERNQTCLTMPRSDITELSVGEKLTIQVAGSRYEFRAHDLDNFEAPLREWIATGLVNGRDGCSVTCDCTPPRLVVDALALGEPIPESRDGVERILKDEEYKNSLTAVFALLRRSEQEAVLRAIRTSPLAELYSRLERVASRDAAKQKREFWGSLAILWGILVLINFAPGGPNIGLSILVAIGLVPIVWLGVWLDKVARKQAGKHEGSGKSVNH